MYVDEYIHIFVTVVCHIYKGTAYMHANVCLIHVTRMSHTCTRATYVGHTCYIYVKRMSHVDAMFHGMSFILPFVI